MITSDFKNEIYPTEYFVKICSLNIRGFRYFYTNILFLYSRQFMLLRRWRVYVSYLFPGVFPATIFRRFQRTCFSGKLTHQTMSGAAT